MATRKHIARDLDFPAIVACAVTPANRPEELGAVAIAQDIKRQRLRLVELHIDRAYVNSPVVDDVFASGGTVFAKPWGQRAHRPGLFTKADFQIDLRAKTITCPAGELEPFEPGHTVEFDPEACGSCPLRSKCTQAASGNGRTVSIAADEARQRKYRKLQKTGPGRALLRRRTAVEHALAHIAARKGARARYVGVRRNLFDLRRSAAIQNLEGLHRLPHAA
jgi:Transposase DDE domain